MSKSIEAISEIAEELDEALCVFQSKNDLTNRDMRKLLIGWVDYLYDAEGEVETKIDKAIEKYIKKYEVDDE